MIFLHLLRMFLMTLSDHLGKQGVSFQNKSHCLPFILARKCKNLNYWVYFYGYIFKTAFIAMTSSFIAINSSLIQGPSGQQVCVHPGRGHLISIGSRQTIRALRQRTHEPTCPRRIPEHLQLDLTADCLSLCKKKKKKKIHQMTSERDWMEPADGRDSGAAYIVQKRGAEVVSR